MHAIKESRSARVRNLLHRARRMQVVACNRSTRANRAANAAPWDLALILDAYIARQRFTTVMNRVQAIQSAAE